jgi:hypothetical protein
MADGSRRLAIGIAALALLMLLGDVSQYPKTHVRPRGATR